MTETKHPTGTASAIANIAKIDSSTGIRAFGYGADHTAMALWMHPQTGLLVRLAGEITLRNAHAAKVVVLLPYAQLLPLASRLWARMYPDGFMPRFETTMNWSASMGGHDRQPTDITFDAGLDHLTAQALLVQAGLGAQQDALAALLVQAAWQLAPLAAASGPDERAQWAVGARLAATLGMDCRALQWEAAVARIAVEWAAVSGYASDVLFDPAVVNDVDALFMVQGLSPDPLAAGMVTTWGERLCVLPLAQTSGDVPADVFAGQSWLHACLDAEDEAQRSAACVLRHIQEDRFPLALVSSDRALTRRIRALLDSAGVSIRDENGWKLSTSRAAATVMALLRAGVWHASTDAVMDWVKSAPAFQLTAEPLEAALRTSQVRDWHQVPGTPAIAKEAALLATCTAIETTRSRLKGTRNLQAWITELQGALHDSGLWESLATDAAGAQVVSSLQLSPDNAESWGQLVANALWAKRRMDLSEFTRWVNQALEGASFQPAYPLEEQVVILPMSQMLGRPFAAVVLAGCDEVRLNPGTEPPGGWTAAQRTALGLPSRDALDALLHAGWSHALQSPACDVLWRTSDDAGETLMPSKLVQLLQSRQVHTSALHSGTDPRLERTVDATPTPPPFPLGRDVPVRNLSASAYDDLRQCPYRFFALRQLGLKTVDELESEVDKRDFGLWLHAVLNHFHLALLHQPTRDGSARTAMLDASAQATVQSMALPEGEFLPFMAAWPAVRLGYLRWLETHEAQGAVFSTGETAHSQPLGQIKLVGRIDRIDTFSNGDLMVLDYKTEPVAKTKARVKDPLEDTQIAFYAALLPNDTLHGGYINVGERDGTAFSEQKKLVEARDALLEGIQSDMQRIRDGVALPALGEGAACDYCQARGLCRKDFWS